MCTKCLPTSTTFPTKRRKKTKSAPIIFGIGLPRHKFTDRLRPNILFSLFIYQEYVHRTEVQKKKEQTKYEVE